MAAPSGAVGGSLSVCPKKKEEREAVERTHSGGVGGGSSVLSKRKSKRGCYSVGYRGRTYYSLTHSSSLDLRCCSAKLESCGANCLS